MLRVVCLVDCWYWCSGVNSVVHVIFGLVFSFGSRRLSRLVGWLRFGLCGLALSYTCGCLTVEIAVIEGVF